MQRRRYLLVLGALGLAGCRGNSGEPSSISNGNTQTATPSQTGGAPNSDETPSPTPTTSPNGDGQRPTTETDEPTATPSETATPTPEASFSTDGTLSGPGLIGYEHTATVTVTNDGNSDRAYVTEYVVRHPDGYEQSGDLEFIVGGNGSRTWTKTVVPSQGGTVSLDVGAETLATLDVSPIVGRIDPERDVPASVTFPENKRVSIQQIAWGDTVRHGHYGDWQDATAGDGMQFLALHLRFENGGGQPLGVPYYHMFRLTADGTTYEPTSVSDDSYVEYALPMEGKKLKSAPVTEGDVREGIVLFEVPADLSVSDLRLQVDWSWSYMKPPEDIRLIFTGQ